MKRLMKSSEFALGLTDPQIEKLAALSQEQRFDEGDLIVKSGERSRDFYLLLSGSASVEVGSDFCTVCVQVLRPGDAFGWSSLLPGQETLFQVRARERCAALRLEGAALIALCQEDSELGVTLLRRVLLTAAQRVHGLEVKLAEFWGFSKDKDDLASRNHLYR